VNKALVSRSRIFQLGKLTDDDLKVVARMALADSERGFGNRNVVIDDDALEHLVHTAGGDARGVLNALELAVETTPVSPEGIIRITRPVAEESIQQRAVLYDKDGDAHYDTISAFIKSVRGSDPDAALYWMAKMVYAGEDPRFIFRRMMILACEDVGMADPAALGVVVSASQAFDYIGLPEGRYHMAHACIYLAAAPKSNSAMAFFDALDAVSKEAKDEVPSHLCDASRDGDGFGHGKGYLYPHAYRDHWVAQQYLPDMMQGRMFYEPTDIGFEKKIKSEVSRHREAQIEAMAAVADSYAGVETSTGGKSVEGWMKRSTGTSGAMLETIRDTLFGLANLKRDSLVLDMHGRTGLLSFEASRLSFDGSIWVIARDAKEEETLKTMGARLPALSRPQVVLAGIDDFADRVKKAAGGNVKFDRIIGRNIVFNSGKKERARIIKNIVELLAKGGIAVLAETIPSAGQRLSGIVSLAGKGLMQKLKKAEDALFKDPENELVNWNRQALEKEMYAVSGVTVHSSEAMYDSRRRLSFEDVEFWFRETGGNTPKSLGDRIKEMCGEETSQKIREQLHAQLDYKDIQWCTVVGYFVIRRR
jgi:putative ATPase